MNLSHLRLIDYNVKRGKRYMTRISDEKLFARTFRMDAGLLDMWLSTAYSEPLVPTGGARIAKNAKTMMRRSLDWGWWKNFVVSNVKKSNWKRRTASNKSSSILREGNRLVAYRFLDVLPGCVRALEKVLSGSKVISKNLISHSDQGS